MITILSGTNRPDALSYKLALFYQQKLSDKGLSAEILDLDELPEDFIVSAMYENRGKNEVFNRFVTAIEKAEKVVLVVPEYNGSFPGILKTFIDGMPYPNPLKDKKIALVGLSSGNQGALLALSHLTDILHYLGAYVLPLKVRLPFVNKHMPDGVLTHAPSITLLEEQQARLIAL